MTRVSVDLTLPPALPMDRREVLHDVACRNDAEHGADFLGLVLSGSVGRGVATDRSDVDVYVVLTDEGAQGRDTTRSTAVDEIPVALSELEEVPPFGSAGWWFRWSFAWAPVLLDRTDGRLEGALRRQATVTGVEAEEILVEHDRLDGWINYAYRDGCVGTTSTCPGKSENTRCPAWEPDEFLGLLEATLDGDPSAIRGTFTRIEGACAAFDGARPEPILSPVIEGWGDELALLRG